jgi:hypothetical protein
VDIARKTAELRGMDFESFAELIENNAARFCSFKIASF